MTNAQAIEWLYDHRRLDPETGCWLYTGDTTHDGKYGRVSNLAPIVKWSGESLVHRISAKVFAGFDGRGQLFQVCSNTLCFNYEHLRRKIGERLRCSKCGTEYLLSEKKFYGPYEGKHLASGGYHPWCVKCWKQYYNYNRIKYRDNRVAWRKANPEKSREAQRNREARKRASASGFTVANGRMPSVRYKKILARDDWMCHICGERVQSLDDLHFDHIIPLSKGGEHSENNIAVSHAKCNMRKYTRVVESKLQQLNLAIDERRASTPIRQRISLTS